MTEDEIRAKYTEEELEQLGDRSPLFRYTLRVIAGVMARRSPKLWLMPRRFLGEEKPE